MAKKSSDKPSNKQIVQPNMKQKRLQKQDYEREQLNRQIQESRQQTLIGFIAFVLVVALIAVGAFFFWKSHKPNSTGSSTEMKQALQAAQNVKEKPRFANEKGGFSISKDGLNKPVSGAPTVEIYMDFMCPGCASLNLTLDPTLNKMLDAGQLNLEIYPMSFMDRLTTDEYSARAASAGIYILENDTKHFMPYVANLYSPDFMPEETDYKPVSDASLKAQMIKAGISEQVANEALKGQYKEWLTAMNKYTPMRSELWNTSGQSKGSMTTPTVRINNHFWPVDGPSKAQMDAVSGFLTAVGLSSDQVGKAEKMPAIGEDKAPISLTASSN